MYFCPSFIPNAPANRYVMWTPSTAAGPMAALTAIIPIAASKAMSDMSLAVEACPASSDKICLRNSNTLESPLYSILVEFELSRHHGLFAGWGEILR